MKAWEKHANYLFKGEWHIHTSWTDGNNTVFEYCEKAVHEGIPLLAFTEHVRRNLDYDFRCFLNEIEQVRAKYDLIVLSGCEAKVLPGGELDVEEWVLQEVDYPVFAFHSFPDDINEYLKSLKVVLSNRYLTTWVHPGLFVTRHDLELPDEELAEIFGLMNQHHVLLEVNRKYSLPPARWLDLARNGGVRLVRGGDIHRIDDMNKNSVRD